MKKNRHKIESNNTTTMNIFWFHRNLQKCAQMHCQKHLVKQLLESAQMLCTVKHLHGEPVKYKPTHIKHPCVLWVNKSSDNWSALHDLTYFLNEEYKFRFNKKVNHKSWDIVKDMSPPLSLKSRGITLFPQAMPDEYKHEEDAVIAYRRYFIGEKQHLANWGRRDPPYWFLKATDPNYSEPLVISHAQTVPVRP